MMDALLKVLLVRVVCVYVCVLCILWLKLWKLNFLPRHHLMVTTAHRLTDKSCGGVCVQEQLWRLVFFFSFFHSFSSCDIGSQKGPGVRCRGSMQPDT